MIQIDDFDICQKVLRAPASLFLRMVSCNLAEMIRALD